MSKTLKTFLDKKVAEYNRFEFIEEDPIAIPHQFSKQQDIEIMGFFAATFAWGQRVTILNKSRVLIKLMDGAPYDFIVNHKEADLKRFLKFRHRTFHPTDALYFIHFLQQHYQRHSTLEGAFAQYLRPTDKHIGKALTGFHEYFFSLPDAPQRTRKHVATPVRKSTCKRLNMFLRWMVRQDEHGVDFGIWKSIKPHQLICPIDVHVNRVARDLGLISRKQTDWQCALELTETLKALDPNDPVKYDFALFGLGLEKRKFGGIKP